MVTRLTGKTGARSAGRLGSALPARTTVTRRSRNVSAARGVTCPRASNSTVVPGSISRASVSVMIANLRTAMSVGTLDYANEWKVAVLLVEIKSVPDDEPVVDGEADVLDRYIHLTSRRFAQQARGLQHLGRPRPGHVLKVGQRQSRIDDVLDDDDIAPFDRPAQVLEYLNLPG